MPEKSEYYKTLNWKEYLCCKGENLLIFMSELQANLLYKYDLHEIKEDSFYTVGYGILPNKTRES